MSAFALAAGVASATGLPVDPFGNNQVGTLANASVQLPDNQIVAPFGQRTKFTAESVGTAVNPNGKTLAVQTGGESTHPSNINIVDASTGAVLQTFGGRNDAVPVYSPDGTALYVGNTTATTSAVVGTVTISKYTVGSDGLVTDPTSPQTLTLPESMDVPFGFAVSSDGATLYAALSESNELGVIDTATMQMVNTIPVGNAPAAVAIVGHEAFVSNRGGRRPVAGDTTNSSAGTPVVSDPVTGAAATGTVSVVDLSAKAVTDTIDVGLQPSSLTVHDGSVFVTNTNSDTVSIINAASHRVTQTFNVEPLPGSTVGSSPNSVAFAGPNTLLVSVGGDNAIAEFGYNGPTSPVQYQGLIPTDWYPNQVTYDSTTSRVLVSNEYGIGSDGGANPHYMIGTLTSFIPPSNRTLGTLTSQVFANNGWSNLTPSDPAAGNGTSQGDQNATGSGLPAIPTRLGQPSAIKHIFLIVKENQTYDSYLGDLGKGNVDSADLEWGSQVSPNLHSLANTFTDFDNFYDPAQQSADGHNWILQADANDYLAQDQATDFARSYPFWGNDALAYQRDGFIWNTVEDAGKTARLYGMYVAGRTGTAGTWQQYYADSQILEGKASGPLPVPISQWQSYSDVPSVNAINDPNYPILDLHPPDQYRVDIWNLDFQKQLETNSVPNLTIISLPDDHTGGVTPNEPTGDAEVADNDLATGRIVSEISHSSVWKNSAIFAEEDDTQNSFDHVDGHRGPLWIASPYAVRGVVNSTYYTQINVTKTIEQILGAQPMNQFDRAAVPMFDAFTNKPNFTPYNVVPNQIPLTQGVTGLIPLNPPAGNTTNSKRAAALTATSGPSAPAVPAQERSTAAAWTNWLKSDAGPILNTNGLDTVNSAQMRRWDWYTATNWSKPYPGDKEILTPDQVLGRNMAGNLSGD